MRCAEDKARSAASEGSRADRVAGERTSDSEVTARGRAVLAAVLRERALGEADGVGKLVNSPDVELVARAADRPHIFLRHDIRLVVTVDAIVAAPIIIRSFFISMLFFELNDFGAPHCVITTGLMSPFFANLCIDSLLLIMPRSISLGRISAGKFMGKDKKRRSPCQSRR